MGGYGSGRRPTSIAVGDCRVIEIGELCDGGGRESHPRGEIVWVAEDTRAHRARAGYEIAEGRWPGGVTLPTLTLRYRQTPTALPETQRMALAEAPGGRAVARCPGCQHPVRKLFAPPGSNYFLCRRCHQLVYRRRPSAETPELLEFQAFWRAVMGPLAQPIEEHLTTGIPRRTPAEQRRIREALVRALEEERPLSHEELRLYCLRLSRTGLSLRPIAALVGSSKSSVQRFVAAGSQGIDRRALESERLERYWAPPAMGADDDPMTLRAELKMIRRDLRRLRPRWPRPVREPEERVLHAEPAEAGAADERPT